jgi:SAM-dependent methyltransferase
MDDGRSVGAADELPGTPGDQEQVGWQEANSLDFLALGEVLTPAREEIERAIVALVPAESDEAFLGVELGVGDGWLSEAILRAYPAARVVALDGSPAMLERAGARLATFGDRAQVAPFRLEDPVWLERLEGSPRCFYSSLVIHHLDGAGKRELFARLYRRLEPGGALLIADVVEPASEPARRYLARAWSEEVRRRSLALRGDLSAYEFFERERWNLYDHPDPIDKPSTVREQLEWLAAAGFTGVDLVWAKAGHCVFGGYKRVGTSERRNV